MGECEAAASQWAELSGPTKDLRGLIKHCVGAIDGILIRTKKPTRKETICVDDFFSGHKKDVGLNMQAVCDAKLRFTFISVMCPGESSNNVPRIQYQLQAIHLHSHSICTGAGKTNDYKAYVSSCIKDLIESLPEGYFVVGDNAYVNTNHMLVPYPGKLSFQSKEDTFNFYMSQLRVRIENAFALLVRRWGVLQKALQMPLRFQPTLIKAVCCLHNFCIDEKVPSVVPTNVIARVTPDGRLADSSFQTRFAFPRQTGVNDLRNQIAKYMEDKVRRPYMGESLL